MPKHEILVVSKCSFYFNGTLKLKNNFIKNISREKIHVNYRKYKNICLQSVQNNK